MIKTCVVCGGEFEARANNARYCSPGCSSEAANSRRRTGPLAVKRACAVCGHPFVGRTPNAAHCSIACRNQKYNEAKRRTGRILRRKPCVVCGTEFSATGHGSGHVKTCSEECRDAMTKRRRREWEAKTGKVRALRERYAEEGRTAEYSRRSRLKNLEKAREREREYARKARLSLKLIREIETKGLEALL